MAATIEEVRQNLSDIADTLDGWYGSRYVGNKIERNVIKVFRPAFDPRFVLNAGKRSITFRCVAYAPFAESSASEQALDALCELTGTGSFIAAVQNSDNWSITVDYAQVTEAGEVELTTTLEGVAYLMCPFDVEVVW